MEAGLRLRALGHLCYYYRRGFDRGGLAAARVAASGNCNGAAVGPVGSGVEVAHARRMLHVVLVSPLVTAVPKLSFLRPVDNASTNPRKYRVHCKDVCCICSRPASCRGKPLGFKVDDTKLKRAGLDYWPYPFVGFVKIHDSWDDFRDYFMKQDFSYKPGDWLVFGSETKGLPQQALEDCCGEGLGGGTIRIPMVETYVRCLNLSVSVGIAMYEAARQLNYEQLQYQPELPEEAQGLFPAEDIYA
ncbi:hypothetical protein HU200_041393 [Digitaria exilis]|uniref:tRNA/rRNA methyltransferase SpoU type domain-containing protein n=1 Tax=Digitaria exilis TaxID=1010633 RepID=A0A835B4I0_9POAL|nr:hypothetical protein HU200_041393 [Digitaria exilis]